MRSFDVALMITALLLTTGATALVKYYAKRANLLDVPNQRSSHQIATPRGGGLSIVIVFLGAVAVLFGIGYIPSDVSYSILVGGGLVAGIGFVDDHGHVPAERRFAVQFVSVTFAVAILGGMPPIQIGDHFFDLGLAGDLGAIVFTLWFINLYNFMDGIDGIASVEAACIAGSVLAILPVGDNGFIVSLNSVLIGSVVGFLVWNWPPAKIFMGDVGSGFVGFILAVLALTSSIFSVLPIWCWLILAGVFVVDSTVTLIRRVASGEEWYSAHNNHAYQKASRQLKGHRQVTLSVFAINLIWLFPIAWAAAAYPNFGWWLTIVAWVPLISLAIFLKAGRREPDT